MVTKNIYSLNRRLFYLFIMVGFGFTPCVANTDASSVADVTPITKYTQALSNAIKLKNAQLATAQASLKTAKPGSPEVAAANDKVAALTSDIALLTTQKAAEEYVDSVLKDTNDLVNTFKQAQQEEDLADALAGDDDSIVGAGITGDITSADDTDDSDAGDTNGAKG